MILDEMFGIRIDTDTSRGPVLWAMIKFDPFPVVENILDVIHLSELLRAELLPIGEIEGLADLAVDPQGKLYAIGTVADGVIDFGGDFGAGLEKLVTGVRVEFMQFNSGRDPRGRFTFFP